MNWLLETQAATVTGTVAPSRVDIPIHSGISIEYQEFW